MGIILVYDVTDSKSYENIDYWLKKIKEIGDQDAQLILLGNKIDMINEIHVDQEQAANLSKLHGIPYFQTSAKDATNLDMAIKQLLTNIMNTP